MRQLTIDGREVITHSSAKADKKTEPRAEEMHLFSAPQTIPGQLGFAEVDLTSEAGSAKHGELTPKE